jgi:hypothetical protein
MVPRTVPVRNAPEDLARVEVNGHEAAIGRLEQRQPLWALGDVE